MIRKYFEIERFQWIYILIAGQISIFIFFIAGLYGYNVHFPELSFSQALWRTITFILPSWLPMVIPLGFIGSIFVLAASRLMDTQDTENRFISMLIMGAFLPLALVFQFFVLWLLIPVLVTALGLRLLMLWRKQ